MKILLRRSLRIGTSMMSTKGKASEAAVELTAHNTPKHSSWMSVKRCMRIVRTCNTHRIIDVTTMNQHVLHATAHLSDVADIRVVLDGLEEELDTVEQLHAAHGRHSHVEEDAEEDWDGDLSQERAE